MLLTMYSVWFLVLFCFAFLHMLSSLSDELFSCHHKMVSSSSQTIFFQVFMWQKIIESLIPKRSCRLIRNEGRDSFTLRKVLLEKCLVCYTSTYITTGLFSKWPPKYKSGDPLRHLEESFVCAQINRVNYEKSCPWRLDWKVLA